MKLIRVMKTSMIAITLLGCFGLNKAEAISDFSEWLQPIPKISILAEDGYYVWGGSVVKGDDKMYHMFYARWKMADRFSGWCTHSEVAHAVSESPGGPFRFRDVALPARGPEYWDGSVTHNPTIKKFGDKYYLYHMGTFDDPKIRVPMEQRNNQRIGVAWADSPNGPWHRSDKPFVDVSADENADDALMVSNPSVTEMRDGKYLVIYKCVAKKMPLPFGGPVTHLAAIAETPLGPITKYKQRIFYEEKGPHKFPCEDPYVWYDRGDDKYYGLVKDKFGVFTKETGSYAFFTSQDGLSWKPSKNPLVTKYELRWADGLVEKIGSLDRPQVLIEDGKPVALYFAVARAFPVQGKSSTFNVHIPLKMPAAQE